MDRVNNHSALILGLLFGILCVGYSFVDEKVEGCDQQTKECKFQTGVTIQTLVTLTALVDIKISYQNIKLKENATGTISTFSSFYCGKPGIDPCEYSYGYAKDFKGKFTLPSALSGTSGQMEFISHSKEGWRLHQTSFNYHVA